MAGFVKGCERRQRSGGRTHDARSGLRRRRVPLVVTCVQCRQEILEADRIGDQEECVLRDHLLAVHPRTIQPETVSELLRLFDVTEQPPPGA